MSERTPVSTPAKALAGGLRPIRLRHSRRLDLYLAGLMLALATLAGIGLVRPALNQPLWLIPLLLFWSLLWLSWLAQRRARKWHPERLGFEAGQWWLQFPRSDLQKAEQQHTAELIGDCLVWPGLQILPFRVHPRGDRYVLICLSDTASAADRRRLRVWLRTRQWRRERQ